MLSEYAGYAKIEFLQHVVEKRKSLHRGEGVQAFVVASDVERSVGPHHRA
jgi:hypothetical protein